MTNIGKAYGFFDCRASKEEIEAEIPTIRRLTNTPSKLELSLIESPSNLRGDSELMSIASQASESGIKYVLEGTYPSATNEQTAKEIVGVLNQVYQSPLYQEGEPFRGEIVYFDGAGYQFLK